MTGSRAAAGSSQGGAAGGSALFMRSTAGDATLGFRSERGMIDGLDELCQVIDRNRQVAEDAARLAPEVRAAAGRTRLWLLAAPKEVGGLELSLPDLATVFATVAEADPTVAWHAVNSLGLGMVAAALGDDECCAIFANSDRPFCYSGAATQASARSEGDGYRLRGAWPFLTGAADAGWALVSAAVDASEGDGSPEVRRFAIPLSALEVGHNWAVSSAMRGTGSHAAATPRRGVRPGWVQHPAGSTDAPRSTVVSNPRCYRCSSVWRRRSGSAPHPVF